MTQTRFHNRFIYYILALCFFFTLLMPNSVFGLTLTISETAPEHMKYLQVVLETMKKLESTKYTLIEEKEKEVFPQHIFQSCCKTSL